MMSCLVHAASVAIRCHRRDWVNPKVAVMIVGGQSGCAHFFQRGRSIITVVGVKSIAMPRRS
jgi:hypothetical protein